MLKTGGEKKSIVSVPCTQNKQLGLLSDPFLAQLVTGEKGQNRERGFYSGGRQWL